MNAGIIFTIFLSRLETIKMTMQQLNALILIYFAVEILSPATAAAILDAFSNL